MHWDLSTIIGGTICAFFILLEVTIIALIWNKTIDLSRLISEPNGDASLARFQFLVFTFVIALSLFLVIVGNGQSAPAFPDKIPAGIFALLGISAGSYVVSKGISYSNPQVFQDRPPEVQITPASAQLTQANQTIQFAVKVTGASDQTVSWVIDPKVGAIDTKGLYTGPPALPAVKTTHVMVTATSNADANGKAQAIITITNPAGTDPQTTPGNG